MTCRRVNSVLVDTLLYSNRALFSSLSLPSKFLNNTNRRPVSWFHFPYDIVSQSYSVDSHARCRSYCCKSNKSSSLTTGLKYCSSSNNRGNNSSSSWGNRHSSSSCWGSSSWVIKGSSNSSYWGLRYSSSDSSGSRDGSGNAGMLTYSSVLSVSNVQRCQSSLKSSASMKLKPYWPSGIPLDQMRQAGILVSLCTVHGVPSFLFTLRSKNMTGYSGHVSFPGGMADKGDKDIVETVLREVDEEIGIKRSSIEVWGKMLTVPGKGFDLAVTPVLGFCGEIDPTRLKVNPDEVSEVFTSSVESLCNPHNSRYTTFRGGRVHSMPAFDGQKYRIWGLTATVLHQALQVLAPELYTSKIMFMR